jgi:hypothetical protein
VPRSSSPPNTGKSVQFDLHPEEQEPERRTSPDRRHSKEKSRDEHDDRGRRQRRAKDHYRDDSPDSVSSGETVDLPPRFDASGRPKSDDPLADKLEDILSGKGTAGKLFQRFAGDLFGPSPSSSSARR